MRWTSKTFETLQALLIEPPAHIRDIETRHKSRLLNVFLLALILLFLSVDGVYLATVPGYRPPWYGYVFLIGSYLLNRGRYYSAAAFFALAMFPTVIYVNISSGASTNPLATLYYLVPGLILSGILLRPLITLLFALIELLMVAILPYSLPNFFPGLSTIVGPLSTLLISTALLLIWMRFRNSIEGARQEQTRAAEAKYRNIVENAVDGIFQSTTDGRFVTVNPAMARMYGYDSPQDMVDTITDISTQLYVEPALRNELRRRLADGERINGFESREYRKDGSSFWTSMNVQAIRAADGRILYYEGTVEDITRRKRGDAELRDSEERYRTLFNGMLDGIYRSSHEGKFIDVNPAMIKMFGYQSREEMLNLDIKKEMYFAPQERESLFLDTGDEKVDNFRMRRKDGSEIWVEDHGRYVHDQDGNVIYHEGILRDITERRRAEAALRETELRFRKIFHSSPIAICITTMDDGTMLDANDAYWRLTGMQPDTALGHNADELHSWDEPGERAEFVRALRAKHSLSNLDDHFFHMDGSLVRVMSFYEFMLIGEQECVLSMFYDISTQRQLETERENLIRQLERQNAESETLRKSLASVLGTFEFDEIIQQILDQIRRVVPYDSASVWRLEGNRQKFISGRYLPSAFEETEFDFPTDAANSAWPILTGDVAYILNNNVQEELADFQDAPHTYVNSWLAIPLKTRGKIIGLIALDGKQKNQFSEHHAGLAVTFADQVAIALENSRLFTELQIELSVREQLIRELESKNAELERFTYTVSHDLKSPLVTINGFLGYLERDAESGNVSRLKDDMQRIQDAVNRMHRLLSELLELSRVGRLMNAPELIPFEDLVHEVVELTHGRLQARGVTVQTQPGLPALYGDRQRLTEFLQNLVDNAAKFMGAQVHPQVEIGQRYESDGTRTFFVKDNGIGIAPEYHEKIFGLFDKLDSESEGTGIGLALVKRIIELHGGRVWVESEIGSGARFCFTLQLPPESQPTAA